MWRLTSSWKGIDEIPQSLSSVITLWAHPRVVVGSSQTLLPTLPFPLEQMVGGVKVIISREGVGEDGVPNRDKGAAVLSFPSSSLRFFNLGISWDKGLFFKLFTRAYLSLLYLIAISTKQKVRRLSSYKEKGNKRREGNLNVLFSSRAIFFNINTKGSSPRQQLYKWRGSTKSSKSSIVRANSRAA